MAEIESLVRRDLVPLRRELAAERENRCPVEVCVSDAGHEVGRPRPERGKTDARDTGRGCGGLRHERSRGLVLAQNELEPRLPESLDEVDNLSTGMSVHVSHAGGAQPVADRARDAQCHPHRMPP
jgi:hypothetical protein